jgi:hypothetical protein
MESRGTEPILAEAIRQANHSPHRCSDDAWRRKQGVKRTSLVISTNPCFRVYQQWPDFKFKVDVFNAVDACYQNGKIG